MYWKGQKAKKKKRKTILKVPGFVLIKQKCFRSDSTDSEMDTIQNIIFSSYRFTTDYMLIAKCGVVMTSLTIVSLKTVFVYTRNTG